MLDVFEMMEMTEQCHKHKPTDDMSYEERVWWYRGFNAGWIASMENEERIARVEYQANIEVDREKEQKQMAWAHDIRHDTRRSPK